MKLASALFVAIAFTSVADDGLIAHYKFSEGRGNTLKDHSGRGHDGRIVGAKWVRQRGATALRFTGKNSYVDFGDNRELKPEGDFTFLAWIKLQPKAFPDYNTNWYLFNCEDYGKEGTMLRIDGSSAKATYRTSRAGPTPYRFGTTKLDIGGTYLVGFVRRGDTGTLIVDAIADGELNVGGNPVYGDKSFMLSQADQSFDGLMYEVKMFDRALDTGEIIGEYWKRAGQMGKDASHRGKLVVRPHIYDDQAQALLEVDAFGAMPLAKGEKLSIELTGADNAVVQRHEVAALPATCAVEHAIDLTDLAPGRYTLSAKIQAGDKSRAPASARFHWPAPVVTLPPPGDYVVSPLTAVKDRIAVDARVAPNGVLRISAGKLSLPIESSFSVPNAGVMNLKARGGQIHAENEHYRVERKVEPKSGRVVISDTITNLTDKPMGVIFSHSAKASISDPLIAGYQVAPPVKRPLKTNPTTFFETRGYGVALVALDDVFIIQGVGDCGAKQMSIGSNEFALDAHASYTLQWAVYVRQDGGYYDMINDLRADEGRNSTTVQGNWITFGASMYRRSPEVVPGEEYFKKRNVGYTSLACLSFCTDDPSFSLEGIEFIEYPKERKAVRETIDAIIKTWPHTKTMFHIAPNLYATGTPAELWPDSMIVGPDGKQTMYAYNYEGGSYFSKERLAQGWRWWSYYPAMDNSYGKALLDSVDIMMDEMGASGAFVDGALWEYGGLYSYDRFDGHTAEIDPATGTITRLKTAVPLKQQHALVAYGRKIMSKGGVLVANNTYPTRTIAGEPFIFDKEMTEGPEMHLLPTPCTLGNPASIDSEMDVHKDVMNKLAWGNLYFYYGEPNLQYESAPAHMYPITVDEVRANYVKGKERIVTALSGPHGWRGGKSLHFVYRYDNRGRRVRHDFVTTVDGQSSRTELKLDDNEIAIVVRLPVQVAVTAPVNVHVTSVTDGQATVLLNGKGEVKLGSRTIQLDGQQKVTIALP